MMLELWLEILFIVLIILICPIIYFKWAFAYWEKRKIPFLKPRIPWGTFNNLFSEPKSFGVVTDGQYREAKQDGYKFIGIFMFSAPLLIVLDPLIIKSIMSTDFKSFMDRGMYFNERDDPLSAHLFSLEGAKWRNLRAKLTPTFTTGKMKMMYNILNECGDQLKEAINTLCEKDKPVDIKDVLARFTTNVIISAAFGIECNTFANADSEFRTFGKRIFISTKWEMLKEMILFVNRKLGRRLRISVTPKEVEGFFMNVIKDTVEFREKNNFKRNDFMQLLIQLKNNIKGSESIGDDKENHHDGKCLTFEELAAQAYVFFIAGFETSSTTMTFCLFELAVNQDIQEKLRREVMDVLHDHGGELTYEAITDMKYMGQVIDETLRKYPPLPVLNRRSTEEYRIPGTEIVLERDTPVMIPVSALHNDPEYFPEPEKFDPERFSDINKKQIHPYTYMPFGEGPRICIGIRFGLMQTKVGLSVLLQNFRFSLNVKTKIPLEMDPASFIQSTLGDIWLNVVKV